MIFQQLFIGAKLIARFQRYYDNMTYPMLECFVTFLNDLTFAGDGNC
jgi:hypothetical protein